MRVSEYVSVNPDICHGKPCFTGTRIMVSTVLELLEAGVSYQEIHKGYPALTLRHIQAALHFAHELVDQGQYVALPTSVHAVSR